MRQIVDLVPWMLLAGLSCKLLRCALMKHNHLIRFNTVFDEALSYAVASQIRLTGEYQDTPSTIERLKAHF